MNPSDPKQSVRELLEEAHPALIGLSHWIHANPEIGYEEHHASDWVSEWLTTAGFEVERGVADAPTALVGRIGPGPLHVAICVEYDALPEVGHACGHNVIAAAGVGAGLALASVAQELGLRVSVFGTPAEETGGGKLRFIDAGLFEDVHAALMVHPWPADVAEPTIIAITQLEVTYRGHEAHAAGFPHRGRNAADALVLAQTAIGLLRQQLLPTDRVHGIVTKGGDAPNIIPALTSALFMIRAHDRERLAELNQLVRRCFEAGALATGTEVEIVEGTGYANMIHDADLAALYRNNAEQLGRVFDDVPGAPVSTDMGDVSHVVPSIHPMIGIGTNGAVNHQREFADACATASADQAILDGALGLAWTVIDAAQDQVLRARLLGDAVVREAVAIAEEAEELEAEAEYLDELAVSVALTDPELAEHLVATADALEARSEELTDLAGSRLDDAEELVDAAVIDEVTGEAASDAEDLAAVLGVFAATDGATASEDDAVAETASEFAPFVDTWEVTEETVFVIPEAEQDAATDAWASPEEPVSILDALGELEPDEQTPDAPQAEDEATEPVSEAAARDTGSRHAAWEASFLALTRHADWEEQFSAAIATPGDDTLTDTAEPGTAEVDATPDAWASAATFEPEPGSESELEAVAQAEPEFGSESELDAVVHAEPEPGSESELEAVAHAEPEPGSESELEAVAQAEPEPGSESELEAVAQAEPEPESELEAVAQAEPEPEAESELDAVAQAEPEFGSESELDAVAQAEREPEPDADAFALVEDIWYSGAPEDELPAAELIQEAPVAAAASKDRVNDFQWIPADEDR
jgi:amidohydrolase